ncbi:hypothetical protein EZ428_21650 [Pedobacter frigiditerrae]|uniref:Uncharacterized protein n=1 Tax=Pedobacter frigiditerrae TaxID=2530452 RepID=A0A4R0MLK8_9SPHI|nr:tail fiber protein [Pedobacter frigiditerrae]TCC87307.1 hypothetical protein EZ428_21650 [Pedobacter frigiditerrae]
MKLYFSLLVGILINTTVVAQQAELNFTHQNINFSAAPRTTINPMSIKLWDNYGNGGGPTTYGTVLEIYGLSSHQTSQLYFGGWDDSKIRYREAFYADNVWNSWITLLDSKNNVESAGRLMVSGSGNHFINGGNVGIGTATPTEKLSVNGKIRAKEIKVEPNPATWPDYVFEDDYKVGTLEELELYVKTNKHLPEMPTAKEVAMNGVELGELNRLLLKKVEELTLYLIKNNETVTKQSIQLKIQEERINKLEEALRSNNKK